MSLQNPEMAPITLSHHGQVIRGSDDQIVPLEYGRRYAEFLPHATFTTISGADHAWSSCAWRDELLTRLLTLTGLPKSDRTRGSSSPVA